MILPNAKRAFIDLRKLRNYSLSFESPKGRHKARVFASALGITNDDAEKLHDILLEIVKENEAELGELDLFGQRYTVDFYMKTEVGEANVRSGWIILHDEGFPRLTTCFVLKEK
ncbi:MAG: DUF6883 domain-containing protein [Pyrinomonadaceae bacterium]